MEDTTMTDPTPTQWTVNEDQPNVFGALSFLRYGIAPHGSDIKDHAYQQVKAALVQCVRDADRLRQARELATRLSFSCDPSEWGLLLEALLDLLADGGRDGDTGHAADLDDDEMRAVVEMQAQTEAWRDGGIDG
jgi:hypothetical protein